MKSTTKPTTLVAGLPDKTPPPPPPRVHIYAEQAESKVQIRIRKEGETAYYLATISAAGIHLHSDVPRSLGVAVGRAGYAKVIRD